MVLDTLVSCAQRSSTIKQSPGILPREHVVKIRPHMLKSVRRRFTFYTGFIDFTKPFIDITLKSMITIDINNSFTLTPIIRINDINQCIINIKKYWMNS